MARADGVGEVARMLRGRLTTRSLKCDAAVSGEKARSRRVCAKGGGLTDVMIEEGEGCGDAM